MDSPGAGSISVVARQGGPIGEVVFVKFGSSKISRVRGTVAVSSEPRAVKPTMILPQSCPSPT